MLDSGETNHSFRRGSLQATLRAGADPAELHQRGQIKTPVVLARYLDPSCHLSGSKRKMSSPEAAAAEPAPWCLAPLDLSRSR